MNSIQKYFPLAIALALGPFTGQRLSAEDSPPPPLSLAVLDFGEAGEELEGTGKSVAALLQVQLTTHSDAVLVERAELKEVLAEQELGLSGAVSATQAAKVSQMTGAEVLIAGRVFAVENKIHIVAKVISASTSRVFGATASYDRGQPLDGAMEKLGKDVAEVLKNKVGDLRGGISLEQKTLATMKQTLDGMPTGKIYVHVPETIIQAVVPDPAAQTEILRSFEALGWQSTDKEQEADLLIRGEAFAEAGMRHGNLWFTRARLEFKLIDKAGKILKTDRVVVGNMDLAPAVSAKGALQKAGLVAAPVAAAAWKEAGRKQ